METDEMESICGECDGEDTCWNCDDLEALREVPAKDHWRPEQLQALAQMGRQDIIDAYCREQTAK